MAQDPLKPKESPDIKLPPVDSAMNKVPKTDDEPSRDDDAIIARARKRFKRAVEAESANRKNAEDDLNFLNGNQWDAETMAARQAENRPCLTINKLKTFVHQITNEQRQNRPAINVSPVGDKTDIKASKIYSGMIRAIERESQADIAYDTGFFNAVANGFGYWRVLSEYEEEDTFDQRLRLERIRNPFTAYLDPDAMMPEGSDAKWGFVTEMMPRDDFEEDYPDAQVVPWDQGAQGDSYKGWANKDSIRVAEYYEVETTKERLVALDNGHTGFWGDLSQATKDAIKAGHITIKREREAERHKTHWYKLTCLEILEDTEVPTDGLIPIVRVIGDEIDVNGKVTYSGVVRDSKDPQRMYNYWRTTEAELVALQPKTPFIMAEGQEEGHEGAWNNANKTNTPYLLYKPTTVAGKLAPPPQRQPMSTVPSGVIQAIQGSAQDMQATTGIRFDATLAERQYDESGKALHELRRSGDLGSFHYIDNFSRALKYTGHLLMVMIPKIYDTARVMTIIREDGKEQSIRLDPTQGKPLTHGQTPDNKQLPIFNPAVGKYGVTVTIGPSYATKRIEASEQMARFMQTLPEASHLIADLYAKSQDWPFAEQIAQRLAKTIPPNILTTDPDDLTPEVAALIQGLQQQIQQMTAERAQMVKQLQDQTADRMILSQKNQLDFEAKMEKVERDFQSTMAKTISQFEAAIAKLDTQTRKDIADTTVELTNKMVEHDKPIADAMSVEESLPLGNSGLKSMEQDHAGPTDAEQTTT